MSVQQASVTTEKRGRVKIKTNQEPVPNLKGILECNSTKMKRRTYGIGTATDNYKVTRLE